MAASRQTKRFVSSQTGYKFYVGESTRMRRWLRQAPRAEPATIAEALSCVEAFNLTLCEDAVKTAVHVPDIIASIELLFSNGERTSESEPSAFEFALASGQRIAFEFVGGTLSNSFVARVYQTADGPRKEDAAQKAGGATATGLLFKAASYFRFLVEALCLTREERLRESCRRDFIAQMPPKAPLEEAILHLLTRAADNPKEHTFVLGEGTISLNMSPVVTADTAAILSNARTALIGNIKSGYHCPEYYRYVFDKYKIVYKAGWKHVAASFASVILSQLHPVTVKYGARCAMIGWENSPLIEDNSFENSVATIKDLIQLVGHLIYNKNNDDLEIWKDIFEKLSLVTAGDITKYGKELRIKVYSISLNDSINNMKIGIRNTTAGRGESPAERWVKFLDLSQAVVFNARAISPDISPDWKPLFNQPPCDNGECNSKGFAVSDALFAVVPGSARELGVIPTAAFGYALEAIRASLTEEHIEKIRGAIAGVAGAADAVLSGDPKVPNRQVATLMYHVLRPEPNFKGFKDLPNFRRAEADDIVRTRVEWWIDDRKLDISAIAELDQQLEEETNNVIKGLSEDTYNHLLQLIRRVRDYTKAAKAMEHAEIEITASFIGLEKADYVYDQKRKRLADLPLVQCSITLEDFPAALVVTPPVDLRRRGISVASLTGLVRWALQEGKVIYDSGDTTMSNAALINNLFLSCVTVIQGKTTGQVIKESRSTAKAEAEASAGGGKSRSAAVLLGFVAILCALAPRP